MSNLPTEESIRKVTDVKSLQDACIALIKVCQKESTSKKQYRTSAANYKQELEAQELVIKSLKEKNETLETITREMMDNNNNQNSSNDQNEKIKELEDVINSKTESEKQIQSQLNELSMKIQQNESEKAEFLTKIKNFEFIINQQKSQIFKLF